MGYTRVFGGLKLCSSSSTCALSFIVWVANFLKSLVSGESDSLVGLDSSAFGQW